MVTIKKPYKNRLNLVLVRTSIHAAMAHSTTMITTEHSVTMSEFLNTLIKSIRCTAPA